MQNSIRLQLLGTGSQRSTLLRATQSIAMLIQNGTAVGHWLFDCGDLTTHQLLNLQRYEKINSDKKQGNESAVKMSRISKIFITHMHGDHIYGLPTLLTDIGLSRMHKTSQAYTPIEVFGPPGLAEYLKMVFQSSDTKCNYPCTIYEMYSDPNDIRLQSMTASSQKLQYQDRRISVEPLFPSPDGFWDLFSDSFGSIRAGHVQHGVDCFGFVYSSLLGGVLNRTRIHEMLKEHADWLQTYGISEGDVVAKLNKNECVCVDSIQLNPHELKQYAQPPKKVTILGDTCNARGMKELIQGSDVLIHESTIAPLQSEMKNRTEDEIDAIAYKGGHSTIRMAAAFAKECEVKRLVLTHFSTRYTKSDLPEITKLAKKSFGEHVLIASDFMKLTV